MNKRYLPAFVIAASALVVIVAAWDRVVVVAAVIVVVATGASLYIGIGELRQWRQLRKANNEAAIAHVKLGVSEAMEKVRLLQMAREKMATTPHVLRSITADEVRFDNLPALASNNAVKNLAVLPAQVAASMEDLLPAVQHMDNLLIVGGAGTCKTTIMQHLELYRNHIAASIILDTHSRPGQWRGKMIGQGRDYSEIVKYLLLLIGQMNERYKSEHYKTGRPFQPVTQFIDEFTLLPDALKQKHGFEIGQKYSFQMLTEGRKVNMHCVWGIHSDRAKPLGLEGRSDLKECFDAIVYLKKTSKTDRWAFVDFGDGPDKETRYRLPPPFVVAGQATPVFAKAPQITGPTNEDKNIMAAYQFTMSKDKPSLRKVVLRAKAHGVTIHPTSAGYDRIRTILAKYNVNCEL